VQDFAGKGVVLDLLEERQAFGRGRAGDVQIHQDRLGNGLMKHLLDVEGLQFEILGFGVAAVDHGRHLAAGTQLLHPTPAHALTRSRI